MQVELEKAADHDALARLLRMQPSVTAVEFSVDACQVRGAFSHVPLWHAVMRDVELAGRQISRGAGLFQKPVHALRPVSGLHAERVRNAPERVISERVHLAEVRSCGAGAFARAGFSSWAS